MGGVRTEHRELLATSRQKLPMLNWIHNEMEEVLLQAAQDAGAPGDAESRQVFPEAVDLGIGATVGSVISTKGAIIPAEFVEDGRGDPPANCRSNPINWQLSYYLTASSLMALQEDRSPKTDHKGTVFLTTGSCAGRVGLLWFGDFIGNAVMSPLWDAMAKLGETQVIGQFCSPTEAATASLTLAEANRDSSNVPETKLPESMLITPAADGQLPFPSPLPPSAGFIEKAKAATDLKAALDGIPHFWFVDFGHKEAGLNDHSLFVMVDKVTPQIEEFVTRAYTPQGPGERVTVPSDPLIAETMRRRIEDELDAIERNHDVRILLAIESGSRAWRFPSQDSDYDVRFIYVHRVDSYLSIEPLRDVIERPIDGALDISGWDLRKALRLLVRSNAVLFEWLA
jgi:hypothetical protein